MEAIKFAMFLAMEVFVIAALLGAFGLALVQVVKDSLDPYPCGKDQDTASDIVG